MVVLRYYYQGKSYPKREFELIDRYWARLKLKMFKNQEFGTTLWILLLYILLTAIVYTCTILVYKQAIMYLELEPGNVHDCIIYGAVQESWKEFYQSETT